MIDDKMVKMKFLLSLFMCLIDVAVHTLNICLPVYLVGNGFWLDLYGSIVIVITIRCMCAPAAAAASFVADDDSGGGFSLPAAVDVFSCCCCCCGV